MSNKTAKTLFIFSPFATEHAGFYQELLSGVASYQQLGNRLIRLGEQAHAFRQFDKVKEFGRILSNIPIKNYQAIGYYFLGVAANSKGNGDQDEAKRLFELAIDIAPDVYKVKGILSLGALSFHKRDFDSALYFYQETIKTGKLSAASFQAIRGTSAIKSIEGSHAHAVRDLEAILPLIKYAPAQTYFDVLNSYAVEIGEVGRTSEARNISRIVINSPFAFAYPEWQGTANDLRGKSRSFVAFNPSHKGDLLLMPEREHEEETKQEGSPARVLSLQQWKTKMSNDKDNGEQRKPLEEMSGREMLVHVLNLFSNPDLTDEQIYRMLKAAEEAAKEPDKK
jgi:tetratricopeptide (TPR) repeat protein